MKNIEIPWGRDQKLPLKIPSDWRVIAESIETAPEPIEDLNAAICKSLDEPIGLPSLKRLVKPDTRIALVMDDITTVAVVGLAVTLILILLGVIFGHSFDWRAEVTDEFKDSWRSKR